MNKIILGDCLKVLRGFEAESIDMCLTSPPYYGLRDYGTEQIFGGDADCEHDFDEFSDKAEGYSGQSKTRWQHGKTRKNDPENWDKTIRRYGICSKCHAWKGQLGLEPTPEMYIEHMTEIFSEVKRVLKAEGTLWIVIGDTYSGSNTGHTGPAQTKWQSVPRGEGKSLQSNIDLPPKCLCMIPERLAWSLIQDGWILRNKIIWYKPNGMPSSVKDRFTNKWEYVFMFSKNRKTILWRHKNTGEWVYEQPSGTKGKEGIDWEWKEDKKISLWHGFTYYFDLDAVREAHKPESLEREKMGWNESPMKGRYTMPGEKRDGTKDQEFSHPLGKNPGDVFTVPSETRTLGAITGVKGAVKVPGGKGWTGHPPGGEHALRKDPRWCPPEGKNPGDFWSINTQPFPSAHFAVFPEKLCEKPIKAGCPEGGTVLDPFCGAGTTCYVAKEMARNYIGIEINPEYIKIAEKRLEQGVL